MDRPRGSTGTGGAGVRGKAGEAASPEESTEPGRGGLQIAFDKRILALAALSGLPGVLVSLAFLWRADAGGGLRWTLSVLLVGFWVVVLTAVRGRLVRPLQTLSNMLAALREGDFSIRARVGAGTAVSPSPDDPLGLAFLEVNALEEILREQRLGAVEATATLRKVMEEIPVVVFAFDETERLRIVNRQGERLLGQPADRLLGRTAADLRLDDALRGVAPRTLEVTYPGGAGRWELRRSAVRQEGHPLQLLVLSDLSRALREEERQAWKRIIRVLSHEINNSLAPIKSISGSLQSLMRKDPRPPDLLEDADRGLQVIQSRAESLGRFMQSYAQLARLPKPDLRPVAMEGLVRRVAAFETRIPVEVAGGPEVGLQADPDQLEQALINLVRNAVDATLQTGGGVQVRWRERNGSVEIAVEDEGPGLGDSGNLFVPFYTTKPGGSGIGLVLSRQIAEGHGGSLRLENRRGGRGARALLALPLDLKS